METPDAELVQQARAGQAQAFDQLVQRYYAACLRYAWRQLGNREDAEEVVQDAFVRAYRSLARCQDPARFRGWLFTILINRCRTHAARYHRRFVLFNRWREREQPATSVAPMVREGDQDLARALAVLSPRLREAFLLKHIEELSYEEMSSITGVGVSALKMRVKRATDALAAVLVREAND